MEKMSGLVQGVKWVVVAVLMIGLGACGMGGAMVVGKLYDDHQLLNEIRKTRDQEIVNAAERVRQFQQQQQQQQGQGAAAPAK